MFGRGNQQTQPSQPTQPTQQPPQDQTPKNSSKQTSAGIGVTSPPGKVESEKKNNFADFWGQPPKDNKPSEPEKKEPPKQEPKK